jgi:cell division protein FtsQ
MRNSGTTQGSVLKRRGQGGKTARLSVAFIRRFFWPIALIGVVVWLCAWMLGSGLPGRMQHKFYAATAEAGFAVKDVLVEGRVHTDPDALRLLIDMKRGDPMFAFHPHAVKAAIEKMPWVQSATVERRLPDTIYIGLTERKAVALWQYRNKLRLVDGKGNVLAESGLGDFKDLPLVVGEGAEFQAGALIDLLRGEPELEKKMEAAMLVGGRRWDIRFKNGVTARLPETDPALALARLAKAEKEDGILEKGVTAVDLRDAGRIIVANPPGAVHADKAGAGNNI